MKMNSAWQGLRQFSPSFSLQMLDLISGPCDVCKSSLLYEDNKGMRALLLTTIGLQVRPGPCLTTATCRCRKNFSQWECSFYWKLHCHWLEFLRQHQIAVVRQCPGPLFKTSYQQISWSLNATRLGVRIIISLWNMAGTSAAVLQRQLSNFRVIGSLNSSLSFKISWDRVLGHHTI